MIIDAKELGAIDEKGCEKARKVSSRYGLQIVCNDEQEAELNQPDLVMQEGELCDNVKKVASKVGYQVVCEDED